MFTLSVTAGLWQAACVDDSGAKLLDRKLINRTEELENSKSLAFFFKNY